jgi:hypothetical protein
MQSAFHLGWVDMHDIYAKLCVHLFVLLNINEVDTNICRHTAR